MAELGVCITDVVSGVCSDFKALSNVVANDPATFDWEMFGVYVGGCLLFWVTGMSFGLIVKSIKRGTRF